jgi:dihydropteroate synthase
MTKFQRPLIMGVLNVTPDSFSDGGLWSSPETAVDHARAMVAAGADVIDVGGESTRPGAARIDDDEERRRVEPVIRALVADGISVSLDTMRSETARRGLDLGVDFINDVSGGLSDPAMLGVVAETDVTYIAMHWRGESDVMDGNAVYGDVTRDVLTELRTRIDAALDAGIAPDKLWTDPGLGFAKTAEHNWQLLRDLDQLVAIGYPVLLGASRKRFLAPFGENPADRDEATATISVLAAESGVTAVRVHDVRRTVASLRVRDAWNGEMK